MALAKFSWHLSISLAYTACFDLLPEFKHGCVPLSWWHRDSGAACSSILGRLASSHAALAGGLEWCRYFPTIYVTNMIKSRLAREPLQSDRAVMQVGGERRMY